MDKLSLAKYFAGRVENIAYNAGKLQPGGVSYRNDGALSKKELSVAINSGKLGANERNVALYLSKHFRELDKTTVVSGTLPNGGGYVGTAPPNSRLSHSELVQGMAKRRLFIMMQQLPIKPGIQNGATASESAVDNQFSFNA